MNQVNLLSRIVKGNQAEIYVKAIGYGQNNTGKSTSILASAPKPILVIDTEKKASIYSRVFEFDLFEELDPIKIRDLSRQLVQLCESGQPLPWKTILLDSGTEFYRLVKKHALEKEREQQKNENKTKLELNEWDYPKDIYYETLTNLKKLPVHLYVTAHEAPNYLPNQIMKVNPAKPTRPDLEKRSEHHFDVVMHYEKVGNKYKVTFEKRCILNKNLQEVLPPVIDNVNNLEVVGLIHKMVEEQKGYSAPKTTEPTNVIRTNAKFESMLDEALTNVQALQWSTDRLVALFKEYTGHDNPNTLRDDPDAEAKIARFLDMTRTELANASGGVVENIE
jgi:hypothetical protein